MRLGKLHRGSDSWVEFDTHLGEWGKHSRQNEELMKIDMMEGAWLTQESSRNLMGNRLDGGRQLEWCGEKQERKMKSDLEEV